MSFAGVALAIGVPQANVDAMVLLGDLLIVGGGALWAATTLIAKGTALSKAPPEKGSATRSRCRSRFSAARRVRFSENITHVPTHLSMALLAYQAFWVVG